MTVHFHAHWGSYNTVICALRWAVCVSVGTWLCALSSWFSLWHCLRACRSASSAWARWAFSRHFWEYCSDNTSISRWKEHNSSLKYNSTPCWEEKNTSGVKKTWRSGSSLASVSLGLMLSTFISEQINSSKLFPAIKKKKKSFSFYPASEWK